MQPAFIGITTEPVVVEIYAVPWDQADYIERWFRLNDFAAPPWGYRLGFNIQWPTSHCQFLGFSRAADAMTAPIDTWKWWV